MKIQSSQLSQVPKMFEWHIRQRVQEQVRGQVCRQIQEQVWEQAQQPVLRQLWPQILRQTHELPRAAAGAGD
jgi:hypothetical protein